MWIYLLPTGFVILALVLLFFLWVRLRYEPQQIAQKTMTSQPEPQRRQFTRVPLTVSAEMRVPDGRRVRGATRDLSLMGAYVIGDATLAPLTECDMHLVVEGQQPQPVRLRLRGRVVRVAEEGFAIEFTGMTRECYENLKTILAVRADEEQIAEEASRHPLRDGLDEPEHEFQPFDTQQG